MSLKHKGGKIAKTWNRIFQNAQTTPVCPHAVQTDSMGRNITENITEKSEAGRKEQIQDLKQKRPKLM